MLGRTQHRQRCGIAGIRMHRRERHGEPCFYLHNTDTPGTHPSLKLGVLLHNRIKQRHDIVRQSCSRICSPSRQRVRSRGFATDRRLPSRTGNSCAAKMLPLAFAKPSSSTSSGSVVASRSKPARPPDEAARSASHLPDDRSTCSESSSLAARVAVL